MTGKPFYLSLVTHGCDVISYISAGIHYFFLAAKIVKSPDYISAAPNETFKNIRNIWCTRITRRVVSALVRSPLRKTVLSLVQFTNMLPADRGCVIVTCHTPWKRLIVQWCLDNKIALIISNGTWTHQKRSIQRQGAGFSDLRDIVKHLRQNGRVIIAGDIFNKLDNCPVKFFENNCNASLFPVRLARIANVPLVTAVPALRNGAVHIDYGPQFDNSLQQMDDHHIMQHLISFFEEEIKKEPGICPVLTM
ncbi:LpxL/LpxP family acyltransferase [Terrimonas alba]|uniref:LpxL/LpxP family acyltransferase n=1 Tax=Terrimonas alba TaxID=3349636 RepID=UPI0035F4636D